MSEVKINNETNSKFKQERKTLCKEEFNNCEIVKENKQLQDKLKR
jgi:hypothetical protein